MLTDCGDVHRGIGRTVNPLGPYAALETLGPPGSKRAFASSGVGKVVVVVAHHAVLGSFERGSGELQPPWRHLHHPSSLPVGPRDLEDLG